MCVQVFRGISFELCSNYALHRTVTANVSKFWIGITLKDNFYVAALLKSVFQGLF